MIKPNMYLYNTIISKLTKVCKPEGQTLLDIKLVTTFIVTSD